MADNKEKVEKVEIPAVGEVLTAEGLKAMRAQIAQEMAVESEAAVFSIPGAADKVNVGLHEQLKASIPTDLKDKPVPEGCIAMYAAADVRAVLPDGNTFVFVAKAVKHVPKHLKEALSKFGCAEYVAPKKA